MLNPLQSGAMGFMSEGLASSSTRAQGKYHSSAVATLWYDTSTRTEILLNLVSEIERTEHPDEELDLEATEEADFTLVVDCDSGGSWSTFKFLEVTTLSDEKYCGF